MLTLSSTTCNRLLDRVDLSYPKDLLFHLARPFKDCHGTHLLGRRFLFLDPCEDSPFRSGFVTYEKEVYLQRSRLFVQFDWPRLQIYSWGESAYEKALLKGSSEAPHSFSFTFSCDKERFLRGCHRVKELILDGLVYQLNLSHEIAFTGDADPFALFTALPEASFSAYICHHGDYYLSLSPERLLRHQRGLLETKPIKGTIPQGPGALEQLLQNPKERAELLMITDLMRNDLYTIAEKGTVHVKELCAPVSYPHLIHMQSTIEATLQKGLSPLEALLTLFPGGSVTGCPKVNAMQYITALEERPRHIFSGSIGYIAPNGDFDFNIAIRTLVRRGGLWSLAVGAGIVFDSDPEKEYLETLCKAKPFLDVMT